MKIIIDIPEEVINMCKDNNKVTTVKLSAEYFRNGTPIPNNATNGDMIKAMFPYGKYNEYFADVEMKTVENDTRFKSVFDRDWWIETYQKGGKNEKENL